MAVNEIPRKLARKVAWFVVMSTMAYGIKAIWEDQKWLLDAFNKLMAALGRAVAGTFSTARGEDTIRAAGIPPTQSALDRRRERLLYAHTTGDVPRMDRWLVPQDSRVRVDRHCRRHRCGDFHHTRSKCLGSKQTAFNAEVSTIEAVVQ